MQKKPREKYKSLRMKIDYYEKGFLDAKKAYKMTEKIIK